MDQGIIDTITNLKSSGLSDSEIKTMLKDIGFEDSMIDEALNYMKTDEPKKEDNAESEITEEDKEYVSEENNLKKHSDTAKLASSIAMNVAQSAAYKVDEHGEKVNNLNNRIDDIKTGFNDLPKKEHIEEIKNLHTNCQERNSNLDKKIDNIDAKIDGLTKIMKDILENQRDILMRLR